MDRIEAIELATAWITERYGSRFEFKYVLEFRDDVGCRYVLEQKRIDRKAVEHLWGTWFIGVLVPDEDQVDFKSFVEVAVNPVSRAVSLQSDLWQ